MSSCEYCGSEALEFSGVALTSLPPKYPHRCLICGKTTNLTYVKLNNGQVVFKSNIKSIDDILEDFDYLMGAWSRGCDAEDYFMDISHLRDEIEKYKEE